MMINISQIKNINRIFLNKIYLLKNKSFIPNNGTWNGFIFLIITLSGFKPYRIFSNINNNYIKY